MKVIQNYTPRACQWTVHAAEARYRVAVIPRSHGKTILALNELIMRALTTSGVYSYVAPEKLQANRIAWRQLKIYTKDIPGFKFNESTSVITMQNGSQIYLDGASDPERLRGSHFHGLVIDEIASMPAGLWEYTLYPTLQANRGWGLFIGTPKGKNIFYDMYMKEKEGVKDWKSIFFDIYTAGVYTEEEIEEHKNNMSPSAFAQEMMCSWDAASVGSYYGEIIEILEGREQIANFPYNPDRPVYTSWDLGLTDKTAVWFAQIDQKTNNVYLIDYLENSGPLLSWYLDKISEKPYRYGYHILPHDAARRTLDISHGIINSFKLRGYQTKVLPKAADGAAVNAEIATVQKKLWKCYFNRATTEKGLNALKEYSSEYDKMSGIFLARPKHNTHSDAADSFRYLMLGLTNEEKRNENPYTNAADMLIKVNPFDNFRRRAPTFQLSSKH